MVRRSAAVFVVLLVFMMGGEWWCFPVSLFRRESRIGGCGRGGLAVCVFESRDESVAFLDPKHEVKKMEPPPHAEVRVDVSAEDAVHGLRDLEWGPRGGEDVHEFIRVPRADEAQVAIHLAVQMVTFGSSTPFNLSHDYFLSRF